LIPFNKPPYTGNEDKYVTAAMRSAKMSGDGDFSRLCESWFEENTGSAKALLTPSCTHALEMAAILLDIGPGDEVIMPSYTFVSTANAFAMRGATIVFVDIRPDTLNIDESLIEDAITAQTKAIVVVHYAGVGCEMDVVMDVANRHKLWVVEDAAQGMMSSYKGKALGSIGHIGAYSFHETKNYTSGGEGGLLLINDPSFLERAEIIREKGTNRKLFFRGMVDKYTWVDIGSSYLPGELQAAYLFGQLELADKINDKRKSVWNQYNREFGAQSIKPYFEVPTIPASCTLNAHMFYLKTADLAARTKLLSYLQANGIGAVFHYVPLHSSPAGIRLGRFHGEDKYTTKESQRLLRLPVYYNITNEEVSEVIRVVKSSLDA
jgi:dTDP-4-amino-4,6-dideoxygalactose transaminase